MSCGLAKTLSQLIEHVNCTVLDCLTITKPTESELIDQYSKMESMMTQKIVRGNSTTVTLTIVMIT